MRCIVAEFVECVALYESATALGDRKFGGAGADTITWIWIGSHKDCESACGLGHAGISNPKTSLLA